MVTQAVVLIEGNLKEERMTKYLLLSILLTGCATSRPVKTIPTEFKYTESLDSSKVNVSQDSMRLTGFVFSNKTLLPLEHAIVSIKGSSTGVFTDANGHFDISTDDENGKFKLYFDYVGHRPFTTEELLFSPGRKVNIILFLGTSIVF